MPHTSRLNAPDLLDALRIVSSVLADHAEALDRLEHDEDVEPLDAEVDTDGADGADAAQAVEDADGGSRHSGDVAAGSDLARTLGAAVAEADGAPDMARLCDGLVRGAVAQAGGAAGRDLASVLGGMAEVLRNADHLDGDRFALALEVGAERLAVADDGSHPGSMAAVVAASAAGALSAVDDGAELADALIVAADDGLAELESGPTSNPDLVERGVVDAAAAGFLLVLDTLASVVTGEALPTPPPDAPVLATVGARFVVRCQVEPHAGCGLESADWLESTWYELGELVAFDGLGSRWRAELVTTLPGAAIEAVYEVGRPRELHVGLVDGGA